jgi:hypothetical protein
MKDRILAELDILAGSLLMALAIIGPILLHEFGII